MRTMTASQLLGALRARRLSQYDFAQAVGMKQASLSAALRGEYEPGPEGRERIGAAIAELKLYESPPANPHEPVFTVPVEADE
jgi:transcriptional regulator with XRE-family HTH domain